MRKLKPQGKVWSERTNSQTNAQMVALFDLFKEPMLLLIAVAVIYFVMGQNNEVLHAGRNSSSLRNFFLSGQPQSDCDGIFRKVNEPLSTVLRNGEP
jgi:Ca2+-transporting ATPase